MLLLIDNNDSFTYNLVDIFRKLDVMPFKVVNIDDLDLNDVDRFSHILISPGPDVPEAYPQLFTLMRQFSLHKSILGVCLGHQLICQFYGAELFNLPVVRHGQEAQITTLKEDVLLTHIPNSFTVGLYHSWAVKNIDKLPIEALAYDNEARLMMVAHQQHRVWGIQFHPESFITEFGEQLLFNWLTLT